MTWPAYLAVCALLVTHMLIVFGMLGHRAPVADTHDVVRYAELYARGGEMPSARQVLDTYQRCDDYPPPLMLAAQAAFLAAGGALRAVPLTNLLWAAMFLVYFALLARQLGGGAAALTGLLLALAWPATLWTFSRVGPEVVLLGPLVGFLYHLMRSEGLRQSGHSLAAGGLLALMALAKISFALHLIGPALWLAGRALAGGRPPRGRCLLLLLLPPLLLAGPWYVVQAADVGCYMLKQLGQLPGGHGGSLILSALAPAAALAALLGGGIWLRRRGRWPARLAPEVLFLPAYAGGVAGSLWFLHGAYGKLMDEELALAMPLCALALVRLLQTARHGWLPGLALAAGLLGACASGAWMTRLHADLLLTTSVTRGTIHQRVVALARPHCPRPRCEVRLVATAGLDDDLLEPAYFWFTSLSVGRELRFVGGGIPGRTRLAYETAPAGPPDLVVLIGQEARGRFPGYTEYVRISFQRQDLADLETGGGQSGKAPLVLLVRRSR